jgi:hypothetical protein
MGVLLVAALELVLLYSQRLHLAYTEPGLVVLVLALMGVALSITLYTLLQVAFSQTIISPQPSKGMIVRLSPAYPAIRLALGNRISLAAALIGAGLYTALYLWAEGLLVEAAFKPTLRVVWEGPPGYAPMLILFPVAGIGVVVPVYQLAVLLSLSTLLALSTAVLTYSLKLGGLPRPGLGAGVAGAVSGLFVSCPVCVAPPLLTILSTYLTPWTLPILSLIFREVVGVALFYGLSLALLWTALALSSRSLAAGLACEYRPRQQ